MFKSFFTHKILVHPKKSGKTTKSEISIKKSEKIRKIWNIRIFFEKSNSVFKSFFIHKSVVHPKKSGKIHKIRILKKKPKKSYKSKDFFWGIQNRSPNLGVNSPSFPVKQIIFDLFKFSRRIADLKLIQLEPTESSFSGKQWTKRGPKVQHRQRLLNRRIGGWGSRRALDDWPKLGANGKIVATLLLHCQRKMAAGHSFAYEQVGNVSQF